ncbi:alpha-L-rhamnosidase [Rhizohabitans arisaemae]|uniref:alpha-L-rhamnosidase n=1 Tax=Rhizohabitans arisaemae TaxID=2720610 RepID=UPI0024B218F8|nr:alpha-L-rhamnosidase [Rhizohabitans arisaemae]
MTVIHRLRTEYRDSPLAVDQDRPRFSWQLLGEDSGVRQSAYRISLTRDGQPVWDSGVVASAETAQVAGPVLEPLGVYTWTVRVTLGDGSEIVSPPARFETGPAIASWDQADWITLPRPVHVHDDHRPTPYLRSRITVGAGLTRARVYATAGGVFQLWLGGSAVSDAPFAPGWTDYNHRVPFHAYDVTERLSEGAHTLGAILSDGWYSGYIAVGHNRDFWGTVPVFRALLVLEYGDRREIVGTGGGWEGAFGPIQASDFLAGEVYDARADLGDWSSVPGSGDWRPVTRAEGPKGRLVPALIDPAGPVRELAPVAVTQPVPGSFVVDFGQNFAGRVRLRATGSPGTIIRMRHAEALNPDGTVYTDNLRSARAADTLILGAGESVYEPTFTYHGFRYAEITGYPGELRPEAVTGVVLSSLTGFSGGIETDNALVNRLQRNIQWSMLSNIFELPTDCPQRDERLGWTGDAQIFTRTALYNADLAGFFTKWMDDIGDTRMANGALPDIAPCVVLPWAQEGSPGYADAGVVVPYLLHEMYGDTRVVARHLDACLAWLDYIQTRNLDLIWRESRNQDYGDWLAPVETPKDLVATAYFAQSALLTADLAAAVGRTGDEERCRTLHAGIADAFRTEYVEPSGVIPASTQTAYVLALKFGLLLPEQRERAAKELAHDVETRGHLTTGFLAVSHLLPVLTDIGRIDLAYRLLLNEDYPSWGYHIAQGATTIWEHWDGYRPEQGFKDPQMNSLNHFVLGSVGEWLYRTLGGVTPAEPGFAHVLIAPQPGGGIRRAAVHYDSIRGRIESSWHLDGDDIVLNVAIPANVTATVRLPGQETTVGSGTHAFRAPLA